MSYLEQKNNQTGKDKQLSFLISGSDASLMSEKIKWDSAIKVSHSLSKHPHTMLSFTPVQLVASINQGRAIVAFREGMEMVGFAQLWECDFYQNGQKVLEFGSWLSFRKGLGGKVLKEALQLGKKVNPDAQLIAVVEQGNVKPQAVLLKVGAKEVGSKSSSKIKTIEGEFALMKIFDITNLNSTDGTEKGGE